MRFVALVSGGKDSVFSLGKAMAHGHELVCLANLYPPDTGPEELDSFMFQSAGAPALEALGECLGVPLLRAPLRGGSGHQGLHYTVTEGDEVEDLYDLIRHVKERYPDVEAVASGAVLSTYQRTRVENVCERLGLQSLAFLWQYDQSTLLEEMVANGMEAVLVKVASQGLLPHKHLGKSIAELAPVFQRLKQQHGFHVAGEGGEYETLTLDASFFKRRLVLDRTEVVIHSDDIYTPVGLLRILQCHTEPKPSAVASSSPSSSPLALLALPPAGARLLAAAGVPGGNRPLPLAAPGLPLLPRPRVWRQGRQLFVSGFSCPCPPPLPPGDAAAQQVTLCLEALGRSLAAEGSSLEDVVFVHLYLRHVAQSFAAANAAYCAAPFLAAHPPARACVEAPFLAPGVEAMLDAWALRGSGAAMRRGDFRERQVLHVRSLSGWAPLCIGPYSQANLLAHGHLALLAGQIGLDPPTMALVQAPSSPEAADEAGQQVRLEAYQALHNCAAVLAALRSGLRTAVMVVAYVQADATATATTDAFACDEAVAEWRRACLGDAGYGGPRRHQDKGGGDDDEASAGSEASAEGDEDGEGQEEMPALAARCPFLVVSVPNLPRGAKVEFEVVALSRVLAGALAPGTDAWTVDGCGAEAANGADDEDEHATVAVNPLPEPFQPPLAAVAAAPSTAPGFPFTVRAESLHLSSALMALHLGLGLPFAPPKGTSTSSSSSSSSRSILFVDHLALAVTIVTHVRKALDGASLAWRQLSRLRFFFCCSGAVEEPLLREAVAGALPPEAQGVARTFVPVSSLLFGGDAPSVVGLVRVQALALDLERLRTEAWIHEVPDGGV